MFDFVKTFLYLFLIFYSLFFKFIYFFVFLLKNLILHIITCENSQIFCELYENRYAVLSMTIFVIGEMTLTRDNGKLIINLIHIYFVQSLDIQKYSNLPLPLSPAISDN